MDTLESMRRIIVIGMWCLLIMVLMTSCTGENDNAVSNSSINTVDSSNKEASEPDQKDDCFESSSYIYEDSAVAQYLEDYDQFWDEIETNYPFYTMLDDLGIDVQGIKDTYRENVYKVEGPEGLMVILNQVCRQLGGYAHLSVVDKHTFLVYKDAYEARKDLYNPWYEVLSDDKTLKLYGMEDVESESTVDEDTVQTENSKYAFVRSRVIDDDIVYIHFGSFEHFTVDADRNVMKDYLGKYKDYSNIIIDISDNPGGDDTYWMENIVAPFGGKYDYSEQYYFADSPLFWNFFSKGNDAEIIHLTPKEQEDIKSKTGIDNISIKQEYKQVCDFTDSVERSLNTEAKRWLLVGDITYSSADSFASFCKKTGWATVVGTRTGGCGSLPPVFVRLDNTGVCFKYTNAVKIEEDGRVNNIYGTMPDIISKKNEKPLDTVLRVLKSEDQ
ncbi:S41 family peptidase [Butyrivibrio sp. MC2013]|uniref:S41 family peptidase n=1 Tax=Butyrivibrio sp. MC2013 TaxID=1280686 RepID=UPI00040D2C0B|nr:S41 family peptidase [Butyrivibrio sp. MC2013]